MAQPAKEHAAQLLNLHIALIQVTALLLSNVAVVTHPSINAVVLSSSRLTFVLQLLLQLLIAVTLPFHLLNIAKPKANVPLKRIAAQSVLNGAQELRNAKLTQIHLPTAQLAMKTSLIPQPYAVLKVNPKHAEAEEPAAQKDGFGITKVSKDATFQNALTPSKNIAQNPLLLA